MIDLQQLQAVVDGECTASERRALLAKIEEEPKYWRTLALSLLEEQIFQKQLTSIAMEPAIAPAIAVPMHAAVLGNEKRSSLYDKSLKWFPALAACLIVLIGFAAGRFWNASPVEGNLGATGGGLASSSALTQSNDADNVRLVAQNDREAYERSLPYADLRVSTDNGEIPLFNVKDVDPSEMMAKQSFELGLANYKLRRSGYEIDYKQDYMTGQLQDGRKVLVPVPRFDLKPYGQ
jgi:hypothetical protein